MILKNHLWYRGAGYTYLPPGVKKKARMRKAFSKKHLDGPFWSYGRVFEGRDRRGKDRYRWTWMTPL